MLRKVPHKTGLPHPNTAVSKQIDRLTETTGPSTIQIYDAKLEKWETDKTLTNECLAQKRIIGQGSDEKFRTAKTTSTFKVFGALSNEQKGMADRQSA